MDDSKRAYDEAGGDYSPASLSEQVEIREFERMAAHTLAFETVERRMN